MSRPTNTLRGARIAFEVAEDRYIQRELFASDGPSPGFWWEVARAAHRVIEEETACMQAKRVAL
ncbi:hypothetical protein [Pseudoxanthomonas mexicana]|uniref:hypothetical protein n=1 Tax=Pseudoxanthomonas mexicana TaxID=128785 RepID=UPI00398A879B